MRRALVTAALLIFGATVSGRWSASAQSHRHCTLAGRLFKDAARTTPLEPGSRITIYARPDGDFLGSAVVGTGGSYETELDVPVGLAQIWVDEWNFGCHWALHPRAVAQNMYEEHMVTRRSGTECSTAGWVASASTVQVLVRSRRRAEGGDPAAEAELEAIHDRVSDADPAMRRRLYERAADTPKIELLLGAELERLRAP